MPILAYPKPKDQFVLDSDAIREAVGAGLFQLQNQPISILKTHDIELDLTLNVLDWIAFV